MPINIYIYINVVFCQTFSNKSIKHFAIAERPRFPPMRWLVSWKYGQMIRSLASGWRWRDRDRMKKARFFNLQDETHIYNKVCLKLKLCNVYIRDFFKGNPSILYTWNWGFGCQIAEIDHSTEQWRVLSRQIFETSHFLVTISQGGTLMRPAKWTKNMAPKKMLLTFIQVPFSGTPTFEPAWLECALVVWQQPDPIPIGPFES